MVNIVVLYYRPDMLEAVGFDAPPKTWEELIDAAKAISDGQIMGYQIKGADGHLNAMNHIWQSFLLASGGILVENGKSSMNSPEVSPTIVVVVKI